MVNKKKLIERIRARIGLLREPYRQRNRNPYSWRRVGCIAEEELVANPNPEYDLYYIGDRGRFANAPRHQSLLMIIRELETTLRKRGIGDNEIGDSIRYARDYFSKVKEISKRPYEGHSDDFLFTQEDYFRIDKKYRRWLRKVVQERT